MTDHTSPDARRSEAIGDSMKRMLDELLAERAKVARVREAAILWRDRPGGDVGLAITLASILDTSKPEPLATGALVRALRECDRLQAAHTNSHGEPLSSHDEGVIKAVRRIRAAIDADQPAEERCSCGGKGLTHVHADRHESRVTSHTYEGDGGPCSTALFGQTCGGAREAHDLVQESVEPPACRNPEPHGGHRFVIGGMVGACFGVPR